MSGSTRQQLGPTKKRVKNRIEETENLLQKDTSLDEIEDRANQLLPKLEKNLSSCKDLLKQLEEAFKRDEAKSQRLENELNEFSLLMETKQFVSSKRSG